MLASSVLVILPVTERAHAETREGSPPVLLASAGQWRSVRGEGAPPGWKVVGGDAAAEATPRGWSAVDSALPAPTSTTPGWQNTAESTPLPGSSTAPSLFTPEETAAAAIPQPVQVMGLSRGITVNRQLYPDVALTIPNGFRRDPQRFLTLSFDATNQVRRRDFQGCRGASTCPDAEFNAELALLQAGPASVELLYTVGNVISDDNNPNPWSFQQLGFRLAANITPTIGVAFGGESQITLDEYAPVDADGAQLKGRTLFAVASAAFPLSSRPNPPVLTVTAGAGNGYYGFNGTTASDSQWGPIGSVSYAFNDRIAVGVEYSGYALSAGISVRPLESFPLTASIFATDFLGNVPSNIEGSCFNQSCTVRFLGRLTYSF
jgi:hypothetical protein